MIAFDFFKFILSFGQLIFLQHISKNVVSLYNITIVCYNAFSYKYLHFAQYPFVFLNQYKDWLNLTFLVHLSEYEISNRVFRTGLVCFKRNRLHVSSIVLSLGVNRLLSNSSKIIINVLTYWLVCAVLLSRIVFQVIKNVLFCCEWKQSAFLKEPFLYLSLVHIIHKI